MVVDDEDKRIWELITNVPQVSVLVACLTAVLNVILPGVGTMIIACAPKETTSKTHLVIGILQFLTSFLIIGWIWAIYWSYLVAMKAMGP